MRIGSVSRQAQRHDFGIGKRLRVCTHLLKLLEESLGKESGGYDALILLMLRKQWQFADFERLARHLITVHESWVAVSPIFEFLHRHLLALEPLTVLVDVVDGREGLRCQLGPHGLSECVASTLAAGPGVPSAGQGAIED